MGCLTGRLLVEFPDLPAVPSSLHETQPEKLNPARVVLAHVVLVRFSVEFLQVLTTLIAGQPKMLFVSWKALLLVHPRLLLIVDSVYFTNS